MVLRLKADGEERRRKLASALKAVSSEKAELENLRRKIAASKTTWLLPDPVEALGTRLPSPSTPNAFTVIASDGSQIDVDRHQTARCYLINIGWAALGYGEKPDASLGNLPHLHSHDEEMAIADPEGRGREQPVEGTLLSIKRTVEECRCLAKEALKLKPQSQSLALMDGSLILWKLEPYPDFVTDALLDKGFLYYVNQIRQANKDKKVALASYISMPRSTEVINALKVALCPQQRLDTDIHCHDCTRRECDTVNGVRDRDLFKEMLGDGERSAILISPSKIQRRYGENMVHFFYINVGGEVARVEVPGWVAGDPTLLGLAHCLILDQCRRGHGYPVALSESHEQAVVKASARDIFWEMVSTELAGEHMPLATSAKSRSKRTRWI